AASTPREPPDEEPLAPAEESAPPEEVSPSGEQPEPLPPTPESEMPAASPFSTGTDGDQTARAPIGTLSTVPGRHQRARYGLLVQFESRPDEPELGRLVDSTVWINDAHPAYVRAAASRSTGYHLALSVALALASLAVEPAQEHAFVTQFLSHWGSSSNSGRRGHRRRRSRTASCQIGASSERTSNGKP
ncbi:MAG: hypothetical protein ACRD1V_09790, partial [Vicinamibacterales bacterium]